MEVLLASAYFLSCKAKYDSTVLCSHTLEVMRKAKALETKGKSSAGGMS